VQYVPRTLRGMADPGDVNWVNQVLSGAPQSAGQPASAWEAGPVRGGAPQPTSDIHTGRGRPPGSTSQRAAPAPGSARSERPRRRSLPLGRTSTPKRYRRAAHAADTGADSAAAEAGSLTPAESPASGSSGASSRLQGLSTDGYARSGPAGSHTRLGSGQDGDARVQCSRAGEALSGPAPAGSAAAAGRGAGVDSARGRRFCELCRCWVYGSSKAWDVHKEGMPHRRQELSLQQTGELGHTIVSVFEDQHPEQRRKVRSTSHAGMWRPDPAVLAAVSRWLHVELLSFGREIDYKRWDRFVHGDRLQTVVLDLCGQMDEAGHLALPREGSVAGAPQAEAYGWPLHPITFAVASLPLAAAEIHSPCGALRTLLITLGASRDLDPPLPPLLFASVAALGRCLEAHMLPALECITLRLDTRTCSTARATGSSLIGQAERFDTEVTAHAALAVEHFLRFSMAAVAGSTTRLRCIEVEMTHTKFPPRIMRMAEEFAAYLRAAALDRRHVVMLGLHLRSAERGSLLGMLARDMLAEVLHLGAPLAPCSLTLVRSSLAGTKSRTCVC